MQQFTAAQIAQILEGTLSGDAQHTVTAITKIEEAERHTLSFIANPKYEHYTATTRAGILLVNENLAVNNPHVKAIIRVADPYAAFTKLLHLYQQLLQSQRPTGVEQPSFIHPQAKCADSVYVAAYTYISKGARIGADVCLYPHSFIGENVEIGEGTIVHAGVKIYAGCKIGRGCILHAGVVIGGDGFGFLPQPDGTFQKIPQLGIVELGNDVEIGANTVIDRATLGSTRINDSVKLDNLIHIAHNVEIGEHTVIAAQTGISGSTKIGKQVMIGGQVGIVGHIKIADGVKINAQSGISKSIEVEGRMVSGSPATDFREHYKQLANVKRIPELLAWMKQMQKSATSNAE